MADEKDGGYNVVFRYTAAAKGYKGVMTWSHFPSKEDFQEWFARGGAPDREVVVEGVSNSDAIDQCKHTPVDCYVAAAKQDCTDPETGEVDHQALRLRMSEIRVLYESGGQRAPQVHA